MVILESRGDGLVGLWWYTPDKEIWGVSKSVDDGVNDGLYIHYDSKDNHLNQWSKVVKDNCKENAQEIINKGYKSFERGRVLYNVKTWSYEVTCSEKLVNDEEFKRKCIEYFNLKDEVVDFFALDHYYVASITGNPALDQFEYGI